MALSLSRRWIACLGVTALQTWNPTALAQDFSKIREGNQDSVVFIQSTKYRKDGVGGVEIATGTGFIISAEGHILTAAHVVMRADKDTIVEIKAATRSRENHMMKLESIKNDDDLDIALLQLPDTGETWRAVRFGNSPSVPKDATLYTLGFPGASDLSSATGLLSAKNARRGYWQTTLPINRGNSGGPIFDIDGRVVAVAAGGYDEQQQVTFAIPESYTRGIRVIAAAASTAIDMAAMKVGGQDTSSKSFVFTYYKSVESEGDKTDNEVFCLPTDYTVDQIQPQITTQNGPETRLLSVSPMADRKNCVQVSAHIKGAGVDRIGPIIVNHRGHGWLGIDITVAGIKQKTGTN